MAKKKSIWDNGPSKYGTYTGPKGNPSQWAGTFSTVFTQSPTIQGIVGMASYTILGVAPTASMDEIKKAYHKLAKLYYPDSFVVVDGISTNCGNEAKFREVQSAYEKIKNLRDTSRPQPIVVVQEQTEVDAEDDEPVESNLITPQLLTEIDEIKCVELLNDPEFCAQEKKDGKHLTLQILNGNLIVRNKKGIACDSAPDFESSLRHCGLDLLIDGEQVKNKFWVWDILELNGENLRTLSYITRYEKLSTLNFGSAIKILPLAKTLKEKCALYEALKKKEGIVFKRMSAPFSAGKGDDQFKFKFYSECSVIVVAGREGKASIGMELYNADGEREFVGYCSCNRNPAIGSIAEIKYLYAYQGGCLYQPSFKEPRDDVDENECTMSQLKYKSEDE